MQVNEWEQKPRSSSQSDDPKDSGDSRVSDCLRGFLLFQIEKLPWGSGKANACGGDVRPAVAATALSSETGKPIREDGKPPAEDRGEMSQTRLRFARAVVPPISLQIS